ncbi:MAG: hypothetical protein EOM91_14550 [Sphingobacteriia bacterium]|nr:hypothetical protein [Sphingobacteriia bacterium]NCC40835.1 hypothetical protein [Gammaproteobacteria bacterium]
MTGREPTRLQRPDRDAPMVHAGRTPRMGRPGPRVPGRQAGVVLVVTLFMMGLLTIIGVSAIHMSTSHFRLVGNLQDANELEMAARAVIERYASENPNLNCANVAIPIEVHGRSICIAIDTRCVGMTPGDPEGSSLVDGKQVFDAHWEIRARPVGIDWSEGLLLHWGLVIPVSSFCPSCPAPTEVTCQ